MNRSLLQSSRYLVIPALFVASLAFAYELFVPIQSVQPDSPVPPDSAYTQQKRQSDSVYQKLIASITDLFNQKRYEECLVALNKANALKPGVPSIQERIVRVEGLIAQQKKTQAEYVRLVTMADDYFGKKDYLNAKASYQMAIDVKPDDPMAREKLNRTMELLRSNKAQNILYDVTIASGDKLFAAGEYEKAKTEYENACRILPGEAYPKEKINAIIKILVDQQVRDELYTQAITTADQYYNTKSYQRSLLEYQKALQQKPAEPYPQERIEELKEILADIATLEKAYKDAIARADQLFAETQYPDSRTGYEEALQLKPKEIYPADRIREIDAILAGIAKKEADFEKFVNLADSFYMDRNFIRARQNYLLALQIKPNESYPQAMLAKTAEGVGSQQANEMAMAEAYQAAIANADRLFSQQALTGAKLEYENALAIKPGEAYPQQRIAEIAQLLEQAAARQKEIDVQYTRIVENADRMFADNLYPQAKEQYQAALKIKPDESYPVQKIEELDGILANLVQQREIDARYKSVLTEANKLFTAKSYDPAKIEYQKALEIKPAETLPAERIHLIDSILDAVLARAEKLEADYLTAISRGDSLLALNAYQKAKGSFRAALSLKPNEEYPAAKISEIDVALAELVRTQTLNQQYDGFIAQADQLFEQEAWEEAKAVYGQAGSLKPAEVYPVQKIQQIDSIQQEIARLLARDEAYREIVKKGERHFAAAVYDSARMAFTSAGEMKPEEPLPGIMLARIDSTLLSIANQQVLDEQFASLIVSSDNLFAGKDFPAAREGYQQALALKPAESYPAGKVAEIDGILAENARIAELERQYSLAIKRGDSLVDAEQLNPAKTEFETAARLKPAEAYPKTKLAEIGLALQELARVQALEKKFREEVETGDRLFAEQSWDPAVAAYTRALALIPSETYPTQKIGEIDSIRQEIARQFRIDKEYQSIIARADQLFGDRALDSAKVEFAKAGELCPERSYWKEQMEEIERIQAEIKRIDGEYLDAISRADALLEVKSYEPAREVYQDASSIKTAESYPREKIKEINQILAEIQGRRQTFDKLVNNGDQFFAVREYYKARENFEQALDLFPDEGHPKEQLRLVNVRIDSIYRANKADYDKAVGEGDGFFNTFEYDKSIDAYTRANTFLPMEDYPRRMIAKIRKTISDNAIADVVSTPVVIKAGEEQKFPFVPVNISSRRNNFIYMKIRNLSDNSFNILMRYGNGDQTSGGLAIRNISTDGEINERLISVKDQDPWYREDNNWISLYPQGGDIEVSFIQVSRAIN